MDIDWKLVRARFAGMTREELLEEAALRAEDYAPAAQQILEAEALARGISREQIEQRRGADPAAAGAAAVEPDGIDLPALIASSDEKGDVLALAKILRERGIPAVSRELDPKAFHASGHRVGRWGVMVSGAQAADAARLLEHVMPDAAATAPAGCGGGCGGGCGATDGACAPEAEEWPEDGDWWKTDPGEDDPGEEHR